MTKAQLYARSIKQITGINVFEQTRRREVVEHRSVLVHILRDVEKYTFYQIRDIFESNGKSYDHSTALFAFRQFNMYSKYNPKLRKLYSELVTLSQTQNMKRRAIKQYVDELDDDKVEYFLTMFEKAQELS